MNPVPPQGPYTVRLTDPASTEVRRLLRRAVRYGHIDRFTTALRAIENALTADPVGWGDPQRRYPAAQLMVYHRIHDGLHVVYAVHEVRPLVWITVVAPVLGHPLGEGRQDGGG